jgi:hypothetical protein
MKAVLLFPSHAATHNSIKDINGGFYFIICLYTLHLIITFNDLRFEETLLT